MRKTPAKSAGVSPFQRAKDLLKIGGSVGVKMSALYEGDVILRPEGAFVVVRTHHDIGDNGRRMMIRDLEGTTVRSIPFASESWVNRLTIPSALTLGINPGDVVLYPNGAPQRSVAAIRHNVGWARTAAPWTPLSDGEILLHIREGKARVVRDALRTGVESRQRMPMGTVVACRNLEAIEPTVWIRTGMDYWVGSNRGLTASDAMISYELGRHVYQTVWIPEMTRA